MINTEKVERVAVKGLEGSWKLLRLDGTSSHSLEDLEEFGRHRD